MASRIPLALLIGVGAFLLVAAGTPRPATSARAAAAARRGGTLRISTPAEFDSVDPALAYSTESAALEFATCALLFSYPDAAGAAGTRLVPEVVRSTKVSQDGRVYTFDLKRTFRFQTGAAVTAQSFADAFNRDADPRMKSPATAYMNEIVGVGAVLRRKATAISGIRVLGRYRLQIRLTRPVGDFTARLSIPFFCPLLPGTPVDPAGIDNPAGSGPYYVAERIVNRQIVLKRNPYYRGGRPANVDQVTYTTSKSPEACLHAVELDRIDHCRLGPRLPGVWRRLAKRYGVNRPGGQLFTGPRLGTTYLVFNHDRPAFKGPGQIALKKAINYALDRPALTRVFGYLFGNPTDQMLPPALARDEQIYPIDGPDLATARTWLAKASLRPRTLVLYAGNSSEGAAVARILRSNLKHLDIDLEIKYYDDVTVDEKIGTRGEPFDLAFQGWLVDYADGAGFFESLLNPDLHQTGNLNTAYFVDPAVTARFAAAGRLTGERRRKAWADLDVDLMRTNPPWMPIFHLTSRNFVSRSYGCFLSHPLYGIDFAAACKK